MIIRKDWNPDGTGWCFFEHTAFPCDHAIWIQFKIMVNNCHLKGDKHAMRNS